MVNGRTAAGPTGGVGLLERALGYTLGSLQLVTPAALSHPTPCRSWDLRALLVHMNDSLGALEEAVDAGRIGLAVSPSGLTGVDLVVSLRNRACRLVGAWTRTSDDHIVSIGGSPMTAGVLTSTGAIEVAVHGWDVARACGHSRPIPPLLAEEMLEISPLFVADEDRPSRFAAEVDVSPLASPGDRLLAFLGRRPA